MGHWKRDTSKDLMNKLGAVLTRRQMRTMLGLVTDRLVSTEFPRLWMASRSGGRVLFNGSKIISKCCEDIWTLDPMNIKTPATWAKNYNGCRWEQPSSIAGEVSYAFDGDLAMAQPTLKPSPSAPTCWQQSVFLLLHGAQGPREGGRFGRETSWARLPKKQCDFG